MSGPMYAIFEHGGKSTDVLGLFASQKYPKADQRNHRALCHLWFSETRTAQIAEFSLRTSTFSKPVFVDKQTLQLSAKVDKMADSKLTAWTEREDVQVTMKCLARVLRQILEIAAYQQEAGMNKFAVKHYRKMHDELEVQLDADYLTVDLVSPTMVREIGREDEEGW
ncbi:hypothetical protein Hte_007628 [Hypoxylon texense]